MAYTSATDIGSGESYAAMAAARAFATTALICAHVAAAPRRALLVNGSRNLIHCRREVVSIQLPSTLLFQKTLDLFMCAEIDLVKVLAQAVQ